MMERARWLAGSSVGLLLLALGGCGGAKPLAQFADDAGRTGARVLRQADELPNGTLRPRSLPSIEVPRTMADDIESTVRARTEAMLDPHLGDLSDLDESRLILRAACYAKDLVEVGQASSLDEAVGVALVQFGADATRRLRVRALAQDLSTAAGGDIAAQLTVFSVCETV